MGHALSRTRCERGGCWAPQPIPFPPPSPWSCFLTVTKSQPEVQGIGDEASMAKARPTTGYHHLQVLGASGPGLRGRGCAGLAEVEAQPQLWMGVQRAGGGTGTRGTEAGPPSQWLQSLLRSPQPRALRVRELLEELVLSETGDRCQGGERGAGAWLTLSPALSAPTSRSAASHSPPGQSSPWWTAWPLAASSPVF